MQPDIHHDPLRADDDIDRKALRTLRERFRQLNGERLDLLRARLMPEHRTFVDALPVLLHSNHAALPGFVDFDTPSGIDKYTPDRSAINAVRKIALSFTRERFIERHSQILGVYVASHSAGRATAALQLTLCSARSTHAQLQQKLARIVRFAADRGLSVSTTLIDPSEQHPSGQPGQHGATHTPLLERDAFYRTAILLAGRYPIWWLVPPDMDDRHDAYCARLHGQRFVGRGESLDLGPSQPIPAQECVISGIELLDRAVDAPYAHLHELMLLECYLKDASTVPLARLYKQRIWRGEGDIDSTLLAHESVEAYLTRRGESERLTLARRCLLASATDSPQLREVISAWRWSDAQLRLARDNRESTIADLQRENLRVNAELLRMHTTLTEFANGCTEAARAHLTDLGHRIARLATQREGTIPRLNPALLPQRVSGFVRVEFHNDGWRLHDGAASVFAAPRLAPLMAWAYLHRLGIDNLRTADTHRRQSCARILEVLARHPRGPTTAATLLIINAEDAPLASLKSNGEAILSDWDDALDFSGFHTSLVAGIDVFDVSTDGMTPHAHIGDDGLIEVLIGLLSQPGTPLHIGCVGGERDRSIEERLRALVTEMHDAFSTGRTGRFVFVLGEGFVIVERAAAGFRAHRCVDEAQLYDALAIPMRGGALSVDPYNARLNGLLQLCKIGSADRDTVLIHEHRATVRVYLMTRTGAMHVFDPPHRPTPELTDDVLSFCAWLSRQRRDIRMPEIRVAKGNGSAHVALATDRDRTRHPQQIDVVAPDVVRGGLVAALTVKFAIERESVRRPSHA